MISVGRDKIIPRLDSLIRSIEVLKANQRDIMSVLSVLLQNMASPKANLEETIKEHNFPLQTTADVTKFNRLLKSKANIDKLVISCLYCVLRYCAL